MATDPCDILAAQSRDIAHRVIGCIGEDNVLCAFVSGSVAKDEVSALYVDGRLEIYSDVDISIVMRRAVTADASACVREHGHWDAQEAVFLSSPDVGLYTLAGLKAQPARPGTIDIPRHHMMLFGDANVPAGLSFGPPPPGEALYLIENRLNELVGQEANPRFAAYRRLKGAADAGTALLIDAGEYRSLCRQRSARLHELGAAEGFIEFPHDTMREIQIASDTFCRLSQVLGSSVVDDAAPGAADSIARTWRYLATRQSRQRRMSGEVPESWSSLIAWRLGSGSAIRRARELRIVARRLGRSWLRVLSSAPGVHAASVIDLIRLRGLIETVAHLDPDAVRKHRRLLDSVLRQLGEEDGTALDRGRRLQEALR